MFCSSQIKTQVNISNKESTVAKSVSGAKSVVLEH